jgi:paraquat-inducible protein B
VTSGAGGQPEDRDDGASRGPQGGDAPYAEAPLRAHSWLSWMWLFPIVAAAVVLGLAWRDLAERGPEITVRFVDAGTLQPGQSPIKYKGVSVGIVQSIGLTADASQVLVRARMKRFIQPYLASGARFWIVQPRVGAQGITGLTTLVSGAYIEMYPGRGAPKRHFTGLDEPPVLQPDTSGTFFTLLAPDASALIPGAPITFRGIAVGEVEGFSLAPSHREVRIYAFVRAPYDHLVHAGTRFWNVAGIDLNAGSQGFQLRVNSWQQLLAGGVAFDTPAGASLGPPGARNRTFQLYDNRSQALRYPSGRPVLYQVRFAANARGLGKGTAVELEGTGIGEVTSTRLLYDRASGTLYTRATIAIDPADIEIPGVASSDAAEQAAAVKAALAHLVTHGLRARLVSSSLITGSKLVSLDVVAGAPAARIRLVAGVEQLPAAPGTDIDAMLRSLQQTLHHLDQATAGPQLRHALVELDATLTKLDQLTTTLTPQTESLVKSLRATSDAAQRAANAASATFGANGAENTDLPRLMRQLSDAARSVRELSDYLDRHPEALLRGRRH